MQLCIIVEQHMFPIPSDITVVRNFGFERVVDGDTGAFKVDGISMLLDAPQEAIVKWLSSKGDVYITNAPGTMTWQVASIKEELREV